MSDAGDDGVGHCPRCGAQFLGMEARSATTFVSPPTEGQGGPGASDVEVKPTTDWVETWSRGSLGTIGRFQIRERLGDGGFGQVFLAFDPRLDRNVALKVLKQAHPSERVMERFFREARAAARLDHPNIVSIYDAGFEDGQCWVAYHLVSGKPLWWYRSHQPFDPPTAARLLRDLADAVDHAHHQGVLHRDLKPANILIDEQGRPRLIDFGLARRSDLDSSLTRDGAVIGTPAYMSPEQALGFSRAVDERSDVYSLGIILFEILSGRRPDRPTPGALPTVAEPSNESGEAPPPVSVRALNPDVPRDLDRICLKAMAAQPSERYATARDLAHALEGWLESRKDRRPVMLAAASAAGGFLAALLLCAGAWFALGSSWTPGFAERARESARAQPLLESVAVASNTLPLATPGPDGPPRVEAADPPGGSTATVKETVPQVEFVGNRQTKFYHLPTCRFAESILEKNRVAIKDVGDSEARGWKMCSTCQSNRAKVKAAR